jgi:hypothetical protein
MVAPIVYLSTDASAPVLTGAAGSMIALLDACLVNGYGAKAAAGWTKPFTGTNLAAYRMGTGGTARRMYLRVDDTAALSARLRGFDEMTDVDTGTEPFPTTVQVAAPGLWLHKSVSADATARQWMVIATPHTMLMVTHPANSVLTAPSGAHQSYGSVLFGQYKATDPAFAYNVILMAGTSSLTTSGGAIGLISPANAGAVALEGHFVPRSHTGAASALSVLKTSGAPFRSNGSSNAAGISHGLTVPSPVTGRLAMSRIEIWAPATPWTAIGRLEGVWAPHAQGYVGNPLDTINGSGSAAGRTFLAIDAPAGGTGGFSNAVGRLLVDLVDWD